MSVKSAKVYKFSRGEQYSCYVIVTDDNHMIFDKIVTPPDASLEIKAKLLDQAEKAVLDLKKIEDEKKWSHI